MKILIRKAQLNYFRSLARQHNSEIEAVLVGKKSSDTITIYELAYTKKYAIQSLGSVCWETAEYLKVKAKAFENKLEIVGDIHSHPNWFPIVSKADYTSLKESGHSILGICSVITGKTKVYFWQVDSSLPCEVEYI